MVGDFDGLVPKLRNMKMLTRCSCPDDHRRAITDRIQLVADGECWLWLGPANHQGYGILYHQGRNWLAHRLSYFAFKGEIPEGLVIDHLCRVKPCVNPDHLEPVTDRTNTLRGEGCAAQNYRKDTCIRGHQLSARDPNNGRRSCSECAAKAYSINVARAAEKGVPDDQHGTTNGYINYQCRCEPCKVAGARMNREQRAFRLSRGLGPDDARHGTYNAYTNWKCRCELCRDAGSRYYQSKRGA